ncbi:UrcA family protein [Sphingosinicella microcystinivorans]|uniref:UrcA family protein n=1 Tax=Sphingosinicella microcystinivorans TaxID=335406 RepID=UPI0022F39547|nr:UrcA family protein [Sphingosinicella microcystinivorans]WBX82994.1 UrcA family protein [Sphingosinicella microcystinivorans]
MTLVKISAIAFAAAMTTAAFAPAAHAMEETVIEANTARPVAYVKYGDLNLATDAGVKTLHDRVRRAATAMCVERGIRDLRREMAGIACRNAAISSAAPQITAAINNAGTQVASNAPAITIAMP